MAKRPALMPHSAPQTTPEAGRGRYLDPPGKRQEEHRQRHQEHCKHQH